MCMLLWKGGVLILGKACIVHVSWREAGRKGKKYFMTTRTSKERRQVAEELHCIALQGVHAILAADPSLQDAMLELLLPHFALFLQPNGPLLKLDACASLQVFSLCSKTICRVSTA